jgi:hypothetical protein
MTEIAVTQSSDLAITPSFHMMATNPTEMANAKEGIRGWLTTKLAAIESERAEVQAAHDSAQAHKWKTSAFKSILRRIDGQYLYYGKLAAACDAGFTLVPNMDVNIFAVRTKRANPKWRGNEGTSSSGYRSASPRIPDEEEQRLSVGEGNYQSPAQKFTEYNSKIQKDGKELYHVQQVCDGFEQIEFPLAVAHPVVMNVVAAAMAKKIFDRIGIVPRTQQRLRGDPIVLGQITRKEGYQTKTASFLIAWYVDARTL